VINDLTHLHAMDILLLLLLLLLDSHDRSSKTLGLKDHCMLYRISKTVDLGWGGKTRLLPVESNAVTGTSAKRQIIFWLFRLFDLLEGHPKVKSA